MTNKKTASAENDKDKNVLKDLEKTISPVLVINNSSLKPYVELFEYAPQNIYQQPLGSLIGFFEIKEYSQESAYVVNFLTSVLKKEYYVNPKRPVTESLDSALHKVNLALSELAKQGNVEWLGKINAAICVLEKNNAHFSVSGNAKIFLYRKQSLSEISEGLAFDLPEPHPLKTFINVSSGRLEKNDRLLITSQDIFHILPILELKKNFQRHEGEKFVQFLRTALSNQMEMIASLVVEISETAEAPVTKKVSRKKILSTSNVFSEKTFANSIATEISIQDNPFVNNEETEKESVYTDKKTGHIYIQGEPIDPATAANAQLSLYKDLAKEKITQAAFAVKNEVRKRWSLFKKQQAKKRELRRQEKNLLIAEQIRLAEIEANEQKKLSEQKILDEIENKQKLAKQEELKQINFEKEQDALIELKLQTDALEQFEQEHAIQEDILITEITKTITKESNGVETIAETEIIIEETPLDKYELSFKEKLRLAKIEQQKKQPGDSMDLRKTAPSFVTKEDQAQDIIIHQENTPPTSKLQVLIPKAQKLGNEIILTFKRVAQLTVEVTFGIWQKIGTKKTATTNVQPDTISIVPHVAILKNLYSRFNSKQKLYIILALILIFIAPLFIVRFLDKPKSNVLVETPIAKPTQQELLRNNKNITFDTNLQKIESTQNAVSVLVDNEMPVLITKKSIFIIQNGKSTEFAIPAEFGIAIKSAYMKDLSLIFLITDSDKVISFSSISKKFIDNKIDFSGISKESFVGTYLTYMYVLDQNSNQIYRFPRADGGFGEKTSWLKDSTSLTGISDMTIDDNIYAISNNKVLKFFKGQQQNFILENSITPVHFDKLFTTPDLQFIYALDTQNSRLVQYSKDGSITAQYFNEALKDGTSFTVDEKNKAAYIATSEGLLLLSIQ